MYYEINVSRNGRHLFATAKHSLTDQRSAAKLLAEFRAKFTDCQIRASYYEESGVNVTADLETLS